MVVVLWLACGKAPSVAADPTSIDWGPLDFQQELPAEGYDPRDLTVRNTGEQPIDVVVSDFDTERLVLSAVLAVDDPPTLPTLLPGSSTVVSVGVIGYAPGERDTEVTGAFSFTAAGIDSPATVTWSFTPIRDLSDTGD